MLTSVTGTLSSEGCVIGVYCRTPLDVTRKLILMEDLFA